jgi:hypothetical protein
VKKLVVLLSLLLISSAAIAADGTDYTSSPEGLLEGGGTTSGSAYTIQHGIGDNVIGITSSSAYSSSIGFIASSVTYATSEAGVPTVSNLMFDGRAIVSGDHVNSDVIITATVSDSAGNLDTATSSIEIDSTTIVFDNLTGNSTYDAATAQLTYQPATPFANGTHTLKITGRNTSGNASSGTITFTVSSGGVTVINGAVLNYPNPFDPNNETTEISYRLNTDANITIYIFNSVGQRIWKREYISGSEGAHAGYNFIVWDGVSDFNQTVGNDIYFCRIVSNGKVIGRGKIAVIK